MSNRKAVLKRAPKRDVQRVPQPLVFNLKVEQVLRAICVGYAVTEDKPLQVRVLGGTLMAFYDPTTWVDVGIADEKGYRFMPESNSALITLGIHPTAALYWLTCMTHEGQPVVKIQGDRLLARFGGLLNCARDLVFNYEHLTMIHGKPRVTARPILEAYRVAVLTHGKPAKFA